MAGAHEIPYVGRVIEVLFGVWILVQKESKSDSNHKH